MLDGIMNAAKNSVPMMIMFFVAGLVGYVLGMLTGGGGFDAMALVKAGIVGALAAFTTSLVFGSAK